MGYVGDYEYYDRLDAINHYLNRMDTDEAISLEQLDGKNKSMTYSTKTESFARPISIEWEIGLLGNPNNDTIVFNFKFPVIIWEKHDGKILEPTTFSSSGIHVSLIIVLSKDNLIIRFTDENLLKLFDKCHLENLLIDVISSVNFAKLFLDYISLALNNVISSYFKEKVTLNQLFQHNNLLIELYWNFIHNIRNSFYSFIINYLHKSDNDYQKFERYVLDCSEINSFTYKKIL